MESIRASMRISIEACPEVFHLAHHCHFESLQGAVTGTGSGGSDGWLRWRRWCWRVQFGGYAGLLLHALAACEVVIVVWVCSSPAVLGHCVRVYGLLACLAFRGVAWHGVEKNLWRTCPDGCWLRSAVVEGV